MVKTYNMVVDRDENTLKRKYFLRCKKCGGESFAAYQNLNVDAPDEWESEIISKTMCHDGFGWELEYFTFVCTVCESKEIEIDWKEM